MTSRGAWILGVVVCCLSGGCESAEGPGGFTVTDSAGVQVVTNHLQPAAVPLRVLSASADREIADEAFYQVTALLPLDGGQVAVGVSGAGSVMIYDEDGLLARTFGRTGDGPGEFRQVGNLGRLPGDSLFVYDPLLRRLSVFSAGGHLGRTLPLSDLAPDRGWSRVLSMDMALALIGEAGLAPRDAEGVYRNSAPSYRIDLEGNVLAQYGEFPGVEAMYGSELTGPAPFGATLATAVMRDRLVVGTGEQPEVRFFGSDGRLTRILRWMASDRTVTQDRMNQYLDFLLTQAPPEEAEAMRDRVTGMPFAKESPALAGILTNPAEETLWVEEYLGPEATFPATRGPQRQWIVFDAEGMIRERIATPEGFAPFALQENLVWGVYRDDLGVESVRAYGFLQESR